MDLFISIFTSAGSPDGTPVRIAQKVNEQELLSLCRKQSGVIQVSSVNAFTTSDKIVLLLETTPFASPADLARVLDGDRNTVEKVLPQLVKTGRIVRHRRVNGRFVPDLDRWPTPHQHYFYALSPANALVAA
jgi:biotin operon repressor